jgi:hypothetical protein
MQVRRENLPRQRNYSKQFLSDILASFGDSMTEGWFGDDHLILFDESEIALASGRYAISQPLPGYQVIGLRGWDDFILRDSAGRTFTVPTVPAIAEYLSPYALPAGSILSPDGRFRGKIKWYLKPIVFGGDPNLGENVIWVSHEQHADLVKFWNDRYRDLKRQPTPSAEQ